MSTKGFKANYFKNVQLLEKIIDCRKSKFRNMSIMRRLSTLSLMIYLWPIKKLFAGDNKFLSALSKDAVNVANFLTEEQKNYYAALQNLFHIYAHGDLNLIRVGAKHDGGYIMLDDFAPAKEVSNLRGGVVSNIAYSFGISDDVSWDQCMAERGYAVFMYDHTIEKLPYENSAFHWFKKGIADIDKPNENLYSLATLIKDNGHENNKGMILKMDVEGAEYDFLKTVTPEILKQFDQIVFELHSVNNTEYFKRILSSLEKLNQTHQLIHLHPCGGSFININGKFFSNQIECTYVLKSKYNFDYDYDVKLPLDVDSPNAQSVFDPDLGYWNRDVKI